MSETLRVTTTPAAILRHAAELGSRRPGEDWYDHQARQLDESGYEIVDTEPDGEHSSYSIDETDTEVTVTCRCGLSAVLPPGDKTGASRWWNAHRDGAPDQPLTAEQRELIGRSDDWWQGYRVGCEASHSHGCDAVEAERDDLRERLARLERTSEQRVRDLQAEMGRHAAALERRAQRAEARVAAGDVLADRAQRAAEVLARWQEDNLSAALIEQVRAWRGAR